MSTITYCDKCNKKQKNGDKEWISLALTNVNLKQQGLDNYYNNLKFCPKCAKIILPNLHKFLKRK